MSKATIHREWFIVIKDGMHRLGSSWTVANYYIQQRKILEFAKNIAKCTNADEIYLISDTDYSQSACEKNRSEFVSYIKRRGKLVFASA